ncbi:MAG: tyrosinase family protein [Chlorobi bacterium]|nr:tyrosinase family protein [Chlorobiota bacterium]
MEFRTAGPDSNGIDPDCAITTCNNGVELDSITDNQIPSINCADIGNWTPNHQLPRYLRLPIDTTADDNDLCDWDMDPVVPSSEACCPNGLSRVIEGQNRPTLNPVRSTWHNRLHGLMGGVMGYFTSPAAAIFWVWHAYVDDVWKTWECNCTDQSSNTTSPVDLYMKDTPKVMRSERDRGEEPNIDTGFMWHSEDIWVRRQDDGLTNHEHQDPEYSSDSNTFNYVYVRVRNRGCVAARGELVVHWAKAGTGLSYPSH